MPGPNCMGSPALPICPEKSWKTYLKCGLFLVPGLLCWWLASVFMFPKFQQIWVDAGMDGSSVQWLMNSLGFHTQYGPRIAAGLLTLLVLAEWFITKWSCYRRIALGSFGFVLNTTVLLYLLGLAIVGSIAGPALVHAK